MTAAEVKQWREGGSLPAEMLGQLEHLRRLCTTGIYKAPIKGGVLVDHRVGALVIGQDLMAGYSQQDGIHYHLYLSESLVFRLDEPKAICTIEMAEGKTKAGG